MPCQIAFCYGGGMVEDNSRRAICAAVARILRVEREKRAMSLSAVAATLPAGCTKESRVYKSGFRKHQNLECCRTRRLYSQTQTSED
jgi:hypothetical protein